MTWSCDHCTYINEEGNVLCSICQIKRSQQTSKIQCPICTLLNEPDSCKCSACEHDLQTSSKIDSKYQSCEPDDEVVVFEAAEQHFDDLAEVVYRSGERRYVCKYDGRECLNRRILCAYMSRFHAEKVLAYAKSKLDEKCQATEYERSCDSEDMDTFSNAVDLEDTDAAYALQLAMDDYDTLAESSESKKSKRSSSVPVNVLNGEVDRQYSVLKSYCSTGNSSKKRRHSSSLSEQATRRNGAQSPPCALKSLNHSPRRRSSAPVYPASILKIGEQYNKARRGNGLEALSDDDKEARLLKLLQKSDRIVDKIAKALPSTLNPQTPATSETEGRRISVTDVGNKQPPGKWTTGSVATTSSHSAQPRVIKGCTLRPYQLQGMEWLCGIHGSGLSGILADEMGLGKTLQVLAFLCCLRERYAITGPHLIVMPLSVIGSWQGDAEAYCKGAVRCYVHQGPRDEREENFANWVEFVKASESASGIPSEEKTINLCLTSYDMVLRDASLLSGLMRRGSLQWSYVVVDEAHRLKNSQAKLFDSILSLKGRRHLLLTGTPLQNNLKELWSLLHFILPDVFMDFSEFSDWFNRPFDSIEDAATSTSGRGRKKRRLAAASSLSSGTTPLTDEEKEVIVGSLHRVLKPFILRRVKEDVSLDLPKKTEKVVLCPLSPLQSLLQSRLIAEAIRRAGGDDDGKEGMGDIANNPVDSAPSLEIKNAPLKKELDRLLEDESGRSSSRKGTIFGSNILMELRKACNHPYLVLEDIKSIPDDMYFEYLISSSGKMELLSQLLDELIPQGHKILIFSQFTSMLNILQGFLQTRGYLSHRLDGSTDRHTRERIISDFGRRQQRIVQSFSSAQGETEKKVDTAVAAAATGDISCGEEDDSCSVFLLSTRAGGVGINLQRADTVILFDSDWNPQMDLQAVARAYRIGQENKVLVLRLISANALKTEDDMPTVEENIAVRSSRKLVAERTVLAKGKFDLGAAVHHDEESVSVSAKGRVDDMSVLCDEVVDISWANNGKIPRDMVSYICDRNESDKVPPPMARSGPTCNLGESNVLDLWSVWFEEGGNTESGTHEHVDIEDGENTSVSSGGRLMRKRQASTTMKSLNEDKAWKEMISAKENELDAEESQRKVQQTAKKSNRGPIKKSGTSEALSRGPVHKANNSRRGEELGDGDSDIALSSGDEEDDVCEICGLDELERDGNAPGATLLICDGCEMSFHLFCLGLDEVPNDDWYCELCCRNFGISSYGHSAMSGVSRSTSSRRSCK